MQAKAHARADELGISFAEYVRRLLLRDLTQKLPRRKVDISILFDLIDEGPETNIARDKDKMVGEAVWKEHVSSTAARPRTRRKAARD